MIPLRHWVVYAGGTMLRLDDKGKDALLEARRLAQMRVDGEGDNSRHEGSIGLPSLVEITDIFGFLSIVNPMSISAIVEWDPDKLGPVHEWNARMKAETDKHEKPEWQE